MARLCIFANLFVATLSTVAYGKNLNTYIEERQKLIAEENDNFLGTV
jgi:F0F1-type ATP synthase membrane subunit b/b'